jgi:hypothetical protein
MGGSFRLFRVEDMHQHSVFLKSYPVENTTKGSLKSEGAEKMFEKKHLKKRKIQIYSM